MPLICVPYEKVDPSADLYEVHHEGRKELRSRSGALLFTDIDWQREVSAEDNLILSHHDFTQTPSDLEFLLQSMVAKQRAKYYKIATMANSTLDALRMLILTRNHPSVIGICMGDLGKATRIVPYSPITYAPLTEEERTVPGQVILPQLLSLYHYRKLSRETPLYALIGDPIEKSPGEVFHNDLFQGEALYLKFRVLKEELADFLKLAKDLPFHGFSVTIPHKEAILPYLDEVDPEALAMGAINTVVVREGRLIGYNTDGIGALEALGVPLEGKSVLILGAGGTARAIAYAAKKAGAKVTLANRSEERAREVAHAIGCEVGGLDEEKSLYDFVINATPNPIPGALGVGLDEPFGKAMYVKQALHQQSLWGSLKP